MVVVTAAERSVLVPCQSARVGVVANHGKSCSALPRSITARCSLLNYFVVSSPNFSPRSALGGA